MSQESDRHEELAHGGLVSRDGDMVTLGDGNRWWLNGTGWARNEADALMVKDRNRQMSIRSHQ
jgi:hypothetical protein